ncbi:MAG TPA: substrate-binding domain-containing protein [Spirochaetia bacterium]|nr:substrate-binding domain-containing protein [Spirochaetia bacterium]
MIRRLRSISLLAVSLLLASSLAFANGQKESQAAQGSSQPVKIGLVVKTLTNPYFVTMIDSAKKYAKEQGVTLLTGAGAYDGDNAGQISAMENMASAGVKGILFTPSNSTAIVPTVQKLEKQGIVMIALDTATTPQDATDGFFATDNEQAGQLIGEYAKAAMAGKKAVIAILDGTPGSTVSQKRHDGFLKGFGIQEGDPSIVSEQATNGDQSKALTAMENSLTKDPNINLVYTINEPAGFGAYSALKKAGKASDVMIVSIDGSYNGMKAVQSGEFAADSMQFPAKMAQMGIDAIIKYAKTGTKPSGYVNTGVQLITDKPMPGLASKDSTWGLRNAWGAASEKK